MRKTDNKDCNTNIYIVCEGSKSEPWFLRRFIEWIKEQGYKVSYECDIFPTPKDEGDLYEQSRVRKNNRKESGRKLKNVTIPIIPDETSRGGNPLYWVEHGIKKLSSYAEVFVVFDKDGHPKMKEAFELASSNDNINIILNSRSFEYYLLLHFEKIYRAFTKTECGEKRNGHTRSFRCCLPNAVIDKECGGEVCINGYARKKGYWEDSKDENTFKSAVNIWRGMAFGEYVRNRALLENPQSKIFELNPYVDFQILMLRLLEMNILRINDRIEIDSGRNEMQIIKNCGDHIEFSNGSSVIPMKLKNNWLKYYFYPTDPIKPFDKFVSEYKSKEVALEKFSIAQGEKHFIRAEVDMEIAAGDDKNVKIFTETPPNSFALLEFKGNNYLIFNLL